jgi:PKD repeat protein
VVLRVNVPPTATVNPTNKSICDGGGPVYFIGNGSGMIDSLRWQVSTNAGVTWADIHDNAIYSGATSQQLALIGVPITYNGYQYRLALKAFCATTNTTVATLTVNSLPVITFASDPIPACGGIALTLTPNITGGSGTWTQHLWTGAVGPLNNYFIQNPTFKTLISDTYILNYKVKDSNGCFGNKDVAVVVDSPDATFNQDVITGCTPATVNFTKDMTGIATWSWDFGDGSPVNTTQANPSHVYTNATPATILYRTVTLTVHSAGGCTATKTSMVTVYPAVDATFTANPTVVCSGSNVSFTALPGANSYAWDYGDGVSGPGGRLSTHLYTNLTTASVDYTVQLTTSSYYGCVDIKTLTITVMPVPIPQFTATPSTDNYNPAGNTVSFTNLTNAGTWTWSWDFGDSGTSAAQNPSHTYTGIGTYNVKLSVTNGSCSADITHQVQILPLAPVASFDNVPPGCAPLYVVFNNTSINRSTPGTTYLWDFGDGSYSTAENPTYTYFTPGTFNVQLTVTGPGGISTYAKTVTAQISPKAYFEVTPSLVFVNDERVRCFNLSQNANVFKWDFGDGTTSNDREPYHKYMEEGVYDITLWAYDTTSACTDKFVLSPAVTVEPAGEVRFSTVFTPNKEGPIDRTDLPTGGTEIDQFFFPPIREKVINYKLQIFNRLGVLIFESRNINIPWNGYYKGKLCPQGVYVWYVEGKYANGQPFKKVGDVTLLH